MAGNSNHGSREKRALLAVEAWGLLIVVAMLAILLLLRWGGHIPWSAR